MMPRPLKTPVYYFMLANHHVNYGLARLTRAPLKLYLLTFSAVYYQLSLEGYQTICVGSFSFSTVHVGHLQNVHVGFCN